MARRRALSGILANWLGHFTSRYSDYEGYWIFGMIVADLQDTTIDLLEGTGDDSDRGPLAATVRIARVAFRDQLAKGRFDVSLVREARVRIIRSSDPVVDGLVNGYVVSGYEVVLVATAVTDLHRVYALTRTIFVARHDPRTERQSARAAHST